MTAPAPARRTRARRGDGERLREEILEAAERLLVESGDAAAVSIRAVADAVGVTPPSIYLHFEDKATLLFAVCQEHFRLLDEALEAAVVGVKDPIEELHVRGRAYVDFGLANPEQYRILFMQRPEMLPDDDYAWLLEASAFSHLVDNIQRAIDAGRITGDPFVLAAGCWASVHGITSLLISKPDFPWPDKEAVIEHVLAVQAAGAAAMSGDR